MNTQPLQNNPVQFAECGPVSQTTTADYVPVAGSIIDLAQAPVGQATYVVQETGLVNGITFKVQGSLDQLLWYDIEVDTQNADGTGTDSSTTVDQPVVAGSSVITNCQAVGNAIVWSGRYFQVCIEDTNSGSHGTVQVNGFAH
jgi:hypothetical protein